MTISRLATFQNLLNDYQQCVIDVHGAHDLSAVAVASAMERSNVARSALYAFALDEPDGDMVLLHYRRGWHEYAHDTQKLSQAEPMTN